VSVRNADGTFGNWVDQGFVARDNSAVWSPRNVDLTAYAGEMIRIGFFHLSAAGGLAGWYIDDIEILKF
jgi:hypothetical protein